MQRRKWLVTLPAAAAVAAVPRVWAQGNAWPTQDLRLIVGFSKNSTSEVAASAMIAPLEKALGRKVVLETVMGKAGTAAAVAQSKDGHTFGVVVNNALTVAKMLDPELPYDPEKDLLPLALLTRTPMVLVGQVGSAADTRAFLEAGRRAGDRWRYGSQGHGSIGHLGFELFKARVGFRAQHQPLPGGARGGSGTQRQVDSNRFAAHDACFARRGQWQLASPQRRGPQTQPLGTPTAGADRGRCAF